MIQLRHTGIYVKDLERMEEFYRDAFRMKSICSNVVQDDELISELLHVPYGRVRISKLITEQGVESGFDDMIELLTVEEPEVRRVHGGETSIYTIGTAHLAFGVSKIDWHVQRILSLGGKSVTSVLALPNGRKCCFCCDPEGNGIELIE